MTPQDFRDIREDAGMTQVELSRELGINRRTVQHYEAGTMVIPRVVELAMLYIHSEVRM